MMFLFYFLSFYKKLCSLSLISALGQFGYKLFSLSFGSHLIDGKGHIETAAHSSMMPMLVLKEKKILEKKSYSIYYIYIKNDINILF